MVILVLLTIILVGIFVFLYNQGYMVINSKSAVSFIGSARGNSAKFTSCSGCIKRIVRFKADGTLPYAPVGNILRCAVLHRASAS